MTRRSTNVSARPLLRMAVPLMFSGAMTVLVSANDTVLVGSFGAAAVAAVVVATSLYLVLLLGLAGLAVAAQILVARAMGAADRQRVAHVGAVSLLITVGSGVVAAAVLLVAADGLVAAVTSDDVDQGAAAGYLRVLALGLPLAGASAALRGYATGCGATRIVLRASIVLAVTDVAVAVALLALGGGPLSVAVSTVVGVAASAATYLLWLRRRAGAGEPVPTLPPRDLLPPLAREFARLGWPDAVMMLAGAGSGVVVVFVISPAGEVALAAARWLDIVGLTSWIALYAVGASMTTQLATSLGAGDAPLVRRQAGTALRVTAAIALVLTVVVGLLAAPLARLAIDDPAVGDAVRGVALAAAAHALWMALTVVANGIVRAHGDTRTPLRASLIAEYAVFLPLGVLLCRQQDLGLTGLFVAHHVYWAAFAAIAGWSALRHLRTSGADQPLTGSRLTAGALRW